MDWLTEAASWLRDLLAQQHWLDALAPILAQTPDWALVAAGPSVVLLFAALTFLLAPRRKGARAQSPTETPKRLAAAASSPRPAPATTRNDGAQAAPHAAQPAGAIKDFFISRAGADAESAAWVANTLEAAGYSCIVQQRDFMLGGHFPRAMEDAFENCRAMIAILSGDYTASPYCRDEWSVAYAFHRKEDGRRLLPVRAAAGRIPPLAEALAYIDLIGVAEADKANKLLQGVRAFRERGELPDTLAPDATPLINHPGVFATPNFTGREAELTAIHEALWGKGEAAALTQPTAVTGLGGVGKSAIGREYARRHLHRYAGAWLVRAEQEATLLADLAELGGRLNKDLRAITELGAAARAGVAEAHRLAKQLDRPFLFVFDNVETGGGEWLDWVRGAHVVITSRYSTMPRGVAKIEIEELPPDAARALLLETAARDGDGDVDALLQDLDGLPLALVQAGAYLRENPGESFATYRAALARRLGEASDDWPKSQRLVAATYAPSIERAEQAAPGARDMLIRAAFYAPDDIPAELLSDDATSEAARKAADALARYSLWRRSGSGAFSMHRLVQAALRAALSPEAFAEQAQAAATRLANAFEGNPGDVRTWPRNAPLAPHVAALSAATPDEAVSPDLARALSGADVFFSARADYAAAEPLCQRALAIDEKSFGPDHPKVAIRLNNLAQLYQDTNRLAEAEPLYRRALTIDEKSFGPGHPEVATDLNNLAGLYQATNRLAEAEPLYLRALAIDEKSFGPDHPKVATRLNNLATLYQDTDRLTEAEPLMWRALAIDEKSFGPDHPTVAIRLNNLAALYGDTNRLPEAEPLMRRALAIDEKSFGPDHPTVAIRLNNLARLYQSTNRLAEAEPLFERALGIFEKSLGAEHPNTKTVAENLAICRENMRKR